MELTDRNEILRQMQNSRTDCPYDGQQAGAWKVAHDCCISIVESVAAIKAEPVRHGRWKEWWPGISLIMTGEEMLYRCSACDAKYADIDGYKYCPNCGAKMDGGTGK